MRIIQAAAMAAALLFAGGALAQAYPSRPVTFIVNVTGGSPEALERTIFEKVKENTGANLIFEGRPGGSGAPGLQAVKTATPDGYTLGITYASAINLNPLINRDLGIDPLKDFIPITNLWSLGSVIMARADFPAKDLRDVVAMAKAKPGTVRFGEFGAGNKSLVAMLSDRTGAKFLEVPFKSSSESVQSVLGGFVDVCFETIGTLQGQKGKLKAMSFGGSKPSPLLPGVPTTTEMFGMEMTSWFGAIAPAGTPPAVIAWMSRELQKAIRDPKITQMVENYGFTLVANSPEEFAKALKGEVDANADIVRKFPDLK
jgi:tripartite-type tricarboxylate transporter receptor subunit TctC